MSPTQPSYPLPQRLDSVNVSQNHTQSSTPVPSQAQPRTRGGFELDDDDDDEFNAAGQDDADVYDPAISFQVDEQPSEYVDEVPLDRNSKSPDQENGYSPLPVQAIDSPAGISSTVPNPAPELRASTVTPAQNVMAAQNTPPSSRSQVSVSAALPKSRLANDVVGILEDRIKDDPRGDIPAWLELIEELKSRNKTDEVRQTYNRFFEIFPLAVSWFPWRLMPTR